MPINNILPFCPTDTGSNLVADAAYASDPGRTAGNVPGVARSALNNKALRQSTYIAQAVAQLIANQTNTDVLDDAQPAKLLAQISAALQPLAPVVTPHLSSSGTHNITVYFFCAAANATVGATYTNNGNTFTVSATIAGGTILQCTANGAPTNSGILTKASGTGDATVTFYAFRAPTRLRARLVGGGGGGGGSSVGAVGGGGGSGGNTSFGTSLLLAGGGGGGGAGGQSGSSGSASLGTGPVGAAILGGYGGAGAYNNGSVTVQGGPSGGSSAYGGAGVGNRGGAAAPAIANSGSGGGGAATTGNTTDYQGGGGGAGGFVDATLLPTLAGWAYSYPWAVGGGGAGGAAGTSGYAGGAGGSGAIYIQEEF